MTSLYSCKNLSFSYTLGQQKFRALDKVNLEIEKGDFVCLSGPSGSGKSTLLNLLGLIEVLQEGDIIFDGTSMGNLSEAQKNQLRKRNLSFIFQNFHLLEVLRCDENVEYFLARQGMPRDQRKERVEKALSQVGLLDHRMKKPGEMSGGQRQRVAIARALAKNPKVIFADEPTASLDQHTGKEIMQFLQKLNSELGVTLILASHDPMVFSHVKRQVRLVDGGIVS